MVDRCIIIRREAIHCLADGGASGPTPVNDAHTDLRGILNISVRIPYCSGSVSVCAGDFENRSCRGKSEHCARAEGKQEHECDNRYEARTEHGYLLAVMM